MIESARKELLEIPTKNGHASTIARVNGETWMAWFGGTEESKPDVDIYGAVRGEDGWSKPFLLAQEDGIPHWNPVFYAEGERVTLFYKVGHTIPQWVTRVLRSEDGGKTFSPPVACVPGDVGGRGPVRNKPIRLKSGRILAPASIETPERWDAFVDISDDSLQSFHQSAFVPLRRKSEIAADFPESAFAVHGKGVIQPTLWQSVDQSVHMFLRSTEGFILRSDSFDEGETWSPAVSTGLPNNNSGIDLSKLADGRIALVLNPVHGNWAPRSPLSLYVSEDDGNTFRSVMHLEVNAGEYSYPAILSEGRTLYVSYTWKRLKMAYWEIALEARA
ncbi:MAG TPA: exo-alpha-sialidase [Clostridia bacterium]|nr:exo-alpha-sialidase [Clostridia bacterium]